MALRTMVESFKAIMICELKISMANGGIFINVDTFLSYEIMAYILSPPKNWLPETCTLCSEPMVFIIYWRSRHNNHRK